MPTTVDYSSIARNRTYNGSFKNTSVGDIVRSIIKTTLSKDGVVVGDIANGPILAEAHYQCQWASVYLDQLAEIADCSWHIEGDNFSGTGDKRLYFVAKDEEVLLNRRDEQGYSK